MVRDRTIVLVTHRTELCLERAKQVVEISEGKARILQAVKAKSNELHGHMRLSPTLGLSLYATEPQKTTDLSAQRFLEEEPRAHGGVGLSVYWTYVRAGKYKWWALLLSILAVYRLVAVGQTWFLKQWGEVSKSHTRLLTYSPFCSACSLLVLINTSIARITSVNLSTNSLA